MLIVKDGEISIPLDEQKFNAINRNEKPRHKIRFDLNL